MEKAAENGTGILMIDSEIEDLCRLCDRVLVIVDGRIVAELDSSTSSPERITEVIYLEEERS
jgi:ribose transport system ATP-binding protein